MAVKKDKKFYTEQRERDEKASKGKGPAAEKAKKELASIEKKREASRGKSSGSKKSSDSGDWQGLRMVEKALGGGKPSGMEQARARNRAADNKPEPDAPKKKMTTPRSK